MSDVIGMPSAPGQAVLPLFPLRSVLFPDGLLQLKIFEARYLDMVSDRMRVQQPFGVVCLSDGMESDRNNKSEMQRVGVLAHIVDVDAEQPGILLLRCTAGSRFRMTAPPRQQDDGLWLVDSTEPIADDDAALPAPEMLPTVTALADAIRSLQELGKEPFTKPYRLDDAGWVANRWCELLPVSMAAKQKLMELEDPAMRLSLVDDFLRNNKVVSG